VSSNWGKNKNKKPLKTRTAALQTSASTAAESALNKKKEKRDKVSNHQKRATTSQINLIKIRVLPKATREAAGTAIAAQELDRASTV
jgi:hypothetical protein